MRAVQEGVAFSFKYGMDILKDLGMLPSVIRAGESNMFLSRVFCGTLAHSTGVSIELYNTDGAQGPPGEPHSGSDFTPRPGRLSEGSCGGNHRSGPSRTVSSAITTADGKKRSISILRGVKRIPTAKRRSRA